MEKRLVAIVDHDRIAANAEDIAYLDNELFTPVIVADLPEIQTQIDPDSIDLLLIDNTHQDHLIESLCEACKQFCEPHGIPVVVMVKAIDLQQKIQTLESGFQDIISCDQPLSEITTRLMSVIYHRIANDQLKANLSQANQAAFSAMSESSNLGNNVQFLLNVHHCSNLDQLGQVFFQTINQYGLNCSLQLRSSYGVKNMDANGMERPLESELLTQLKDVGRYYDFGKRSVANYGCVSILIKNMPEDEVQYGMIKDNTFTLLQGMDARVRSLDEHSKLEEEKDSLEKMSHTVTHVMKGIEMEFHAIMTSIVDVVEDAACKIERGIPSLMLNEEDEAFIETTMNHCITEANRRFSNGLKIEQHFKGLEEQIKHVLETAQTEEIPHHEPIMDMHVGDQGTEDVELF